MSDAHRGDPYSGKLAWVTLVTLQVKHHAMEVFSVTILTTFVKKTSTITLDCGRGGFGGGIMSIHYN